MGTGKWEYNQDMAQPFKHDELFLKQYFLKLARDFYADNSKVENELAAAVLYMNLADYLAEYLVICLTEMVKEAVKIYYLGMVSFKPPQGQKFNIDKSIKVLERYDFPKKDEIMGELEEVKDARNKVAHQLLKVKGKDLHTIDAAVTNLRDHTEALVILIDEIDPQLPPTNLKDLVAPPSSKNQK